MTVYLDVIWALNFLFDTLLLYLTAIILKRRFKYLKLISGGFIGSIIILLSVTPLHTYSNHPFAKLFFSLLMVLTAFGYKRFSYLIKGLMTLYLVTFLTGGALIGTHYFIQFDFHLASNVALRSIQGFGDPISWLFVLIGFPVAWHFSKNTMANIEMTKIHYDQIVEVTIKIEDHQFRVKGLIDSGNQLYDPISKWPVMFVSIHAMNELHEAFNLIASHSEKIIHGEMELEANLERKMRIIPYKVVGGEHQLILALKPDEIEIEMKGEKLIVESGLVSFTNQQLSSDDVFQCIVHPKMLTGIKTGKSKVS